MKVCCVDGKPIDGIRCEDGHIAIEDYIFNVVCVHGIETGEYCNWCAGQYANSTEEQK